MKVKESEKGGKQGRIILSIRSCKRRLEALYSFPCNKEVSIALFTGNYGANVITRRISFWCQSALKRSAGLSKALPENLK